MRDEEKELMSPEITATSRGFPFAPSEGIVVPLECRTTSRVFMIASDLDKKEVS